MPTDTIDRNKIEAAIAAVAKRQIKQDFTQYEPQPSHIYTDAQGKMVFVKSRYKNLQTGDKWMRSFHYDDAGRLKQKEPDFNKVYPEGGGKKPVYGLYNALQNPEAPIYAVEGEHVVDLFTSIGLVAVTAGGATQIDSFHWSPIAGRNVTLWRDNDDAGSKWLMSLCKTLAQLDCDISVIDVDALDLSEKDDAIDYKDRRYAGGDDDDSSIASTIKNLSTLTDKQIALLLNDDSGVTSTPIIANANSVAYEGGIICGLDDGVYFIKYDDDGEVKFKTFICSPLEVLARSRNATSEAWGMVLRWVDRDGMPHTWAMPIDKLYGDSRDYRKELAHKGLVISTQTKAQQALDHYLTHHPNDIRALCVDKTGWHGDVYVTPERTVGGDDKQMIVYQPDWYAEPIYSQQGTLEQWQKEVCKPLAEQTRIVLAIACGFAGQLLSLVDMEGGGVHMRGGSSMGKSIGQKVAASIWGHPTKVVGSWRTTDNALEGRALMANDSFLALDEISEGDAKAVAKSIYMVTNGKGKGRAKASGGNRPTKSWLTILLSNGEHPLSYHLQQAGLKVNAGQEVRLINVEADAGKGYRSFDSLVLADTPEAQADKINDLAQQYYGMAGVAWLEYLTANKAQCTTTAKSYIDHFMSQYSDVKAQAYRVGKRFALIATAGEMATDAGITGWQTGQASHAAKVCFDNWLENYGRGGNHEERQIIKTVKSFIEQHGSSRFQPIPILRKQPQYL